MDKKELEAVERAWRADTPMCGTCGWASCFYEVEEDLLREEDRDTETHKAYWTSCHGEYSEEGRHRGVYVYVPKEERDDPQV